MVQPYLPAVEAHGETAIVFFGGEPSHVLRKGVVLGADEEAPIREEGVGTAEVMWDPELVVAGEAAEAEFELARRVIAHVSRALRRPSALRARGHAARRRRRAGAAGARGGGAVPVPGHGARCRRAGWRPRSAPRPSPRGSSPAARSPWSHE